MPPRDNSILNLSAIAAAVDGKLDGPDLAIRGLAPLHAAGPDELTFLGDQAHAERWAAARAGAALISQGLTAAAQPGRALIRVQDADLAMGQALALFAPEPVRPDPGVHAAAVIDAEARIDPTACIGPLCYVGPRASIETGAILHAGVHVHAYSRVGARSELWSGTVVRERCTIGMRCLLHPNVSIGSDGFGFRPGPDGAWVKIPQIGTVEIGDDVEIGAGSCIDRGKFAATVIGCGVKIDNLVQIAHNCRIGDHCVIAGQTGLAGSVTLGHHVLIGGQVSIRDHVTVGDGARIAGAAAVVSDVPAGGHVGGYPAQDMRAALRETAAIRKLPDLIKLLKNKGSSA